MDKIEKIKQEIERRINDLKGYVLQKGSDQRWVTAIDQLTWIKAFIDSLQEEPTVKGITWKDVNILDTLINQVRYEFPNGIGEKSFGLAVLEKFQDYQDDIEEPASEDLDFLVISLEETIGTSPHSREVIKEHLQKAAEWGRNHIEDKSEMVSEDLEEAANQHSKQVFHGLLVEDNITAFKAGAEWKEQKDQETIELAEDHAMLAGMNRMKEEMMKDAVEAFVNIYENTDDSNYVEFVTEQSPYKFKETEKCKIIIVKED